MKKNKLYLGLRNLKNLIIYYLPSSFYHRYCIRKFYSQFIQRGDLCFDVGANIGNRTEIFLGLGAKVIAVEPQEVCAKRLTKRFGQHQDFKLVQMALGERGGEAQLLVNEDAPTISSLSKDWIRSVKSSGRFSDHEWNVVTTVPMTTLQDLIISYGRPVFCKIDVEGYEYQVLRGLKEPISFISFEFTPEFIDASLNCIEYLSRLGNVQFNYSVGEALCLKLSSWVDLKKMRDILIRIPNQKIFGDIYAKYTF